MSGERTVVAWVVVSVPKRGASYPYIETVRGTRKASVLAFDEGLPSDSPIAFAAMKAAGRAKVVRCIVEYPA